MIVTCVHVFVKKEFVDDFISATRINHYETRKEAGNLRFDIIQLEILSQKFVLYEVFESEEASAFHKTTSHYLTWRNTVENWMEQPRQGVKYRVIEPQNKELW